MEDDLYKILQVDPSADPEVIEAAYQRLARKWHPDVNKSPDAAEKIRQLNAAYEVLQNPFKRARAITQRPAAMIAPIRSCGSVRTSLPL